MSETKYLIPDVKQFCTITKIDEDKRLVYGIATTDKLDNQDEIVEWQATKAALDDYKRWGNIREMHGPSAVGKLEDLEVDDEKRQLNICAKIVDDSAWQKCKEKVYRGFSIGGKALERVKEMDSKIGKMISKVKRFVLSEISLVDRPANPECVFTLVKRDFTNSLDPLYEDVQSIRKIAESLEKKILSPSEIGNLPDGSFGLIKGDKRMFPMPTPAHAKAVLKGLQYNKNITDKEMEVIHKRAARVLGNRHNIESCPVCVSIVNKTLLEKERGTMSKTDIQKAETILKDILGDQDYETPPATSPDAGIYGEALAPAAEKPRFDEEARPTLEGPKYQDAEGGEDAEAEYGYGYSEGQEGDEPYNIEDSEQDRQAMEEFEVPEDYEEEEEEEDNEGAKRSCPYCGVTKKLLDRGDIAKGEAECPGCGLIHRVNTRLLREYDVDGGQRIGKRAAPARRQIAKSDPLTDAVIALSEVVPSLMERVEKMERAPGPRQIAKRVEKEGVLGDEDIQKLDSLKTKAVMLRKRERESHKPLSPEEEAFCQAALDASISAKFGQ